MNVVGETSDLVGKEGRGGWTGTEPRFFFREMRGEGYPVKRKREKESERGEWRWRRRGVSKERKLERRRGTKRAR